MSDYLRDGAAIYRQSFAIIRSEANLSAFPPDVANVVVRMIHGCGQVDLADDVVATPGVVAAARAALEAGAPILCDANMVASGVTRRRLPVDNDVLCFLGEPGLAELAQRLNTTRTAAALEYWKPLLAGSVVAIGNAPTALFALLDLIDAGADKPAAIVGAPVGFVGAAESCEALAARTDLEFLTVRGRRGGSAIVASALNALASTSEV
ncbi:precorrin-8X methylmutase [Gordonia sp. (in: high G+C Gram-positive bacteria)]|jgi:precorrin-8X/cobalt-precorrin-8 methylmutase|uniref:precorrin-8X methylmutase n=1 Tax=Gordonia sp. (in: high G+C Gram-positive bacteria) TaxID=84139 RepID=UPI001D60BFB4|nr:precorrin-8X methylmutase [Gordonia sp. (in: high G+C Gram-positive bacteria)]MCB1294096.1 precorrin-8X methylmutase [Gordonia sp. (in: high G+C Gram-positive bacteria)]HMS76772.1 precorrin-8X methylmutase [Gordonia sp. (in: high G+C Gram-positive bacteria)]HQV20275.1 precorrin-8X methylmutase [Gordonia sp. (in: high G+C Gram-positive bacteria)]